MIGVAYIANSSSNRRLTALHSAASPICSGTIWLADGNAGNPAAVSRRFKVSARSNSVARRAASERTWRTDATAAAAIIGGSDIRDYVEATARKFGIFEKIRFGQQVTEASWSSETRRWSVNTANGDLTCAFLYLATGYYDYAQGYRPRWPGEDQFEGEIVHPQFWPEDLDVGRKRIARLMAAAELIGVSRRRFVTTTVRGRGRQAPDLVERKFAADRPDLLWVADTTYVPTATGFLYLAVVLDACSRRIVGWAMGTKLVTGLVLDALEMALATRRPNGVIHHSDQGSQYTSIEFGQRCRAAGVRPSMGSVGDAYDNAMCESFFATLECELLARQRFNNQAAARTALFGFIEGFYNRRRRHSAIGYLSPVDYERQQATAPGPQQDAVVLAAVKDKPSGRPHVAVLDGRCARRLRTPAGRDGRMASTEQKNGTSEEDRMASHDLA